MATQWTDSVIQKGGGTKVSPKHITELRSAIVAEETRRNVAVSGFNDTIAIGTPVKKMHIDDLRTACKTINSSNFTDDTIVIGNTEVKEVHIDELRLRVNTYESYSPGAFSPHGCSAACTGFCTSCTNACTSCTSCTNACTSCTSCTGCTGCTSCTSCTGTCTGTNSGGSH